MALTEVNSLGIKDGEVKTADIAADAVTGAKIADDAVGAEHIEQLDANISFADSTKLLFGAGNDLEIFHDGSNSYIAEVGTGDLVVNSNSTISLNPNAGGEYGFRVHSNGAVEGYYDNAKKFETTASGITVTGGVTTTTASTFVGNVTFDNGTNAGKDIVWDEGNDRLVFKDSVNAFFGDGLDLRLYHDGSNSYIQHGTTGNLRYQSGNHDFYNQAGDEFQCRMIQNGSVELYHDGSKKFETTSTGATVTGSISTANTAKAWIAMNMSSGSSLDSFGVSSISDEGTGTFDVNFSTALSNNNAAAFASVSDSALHAQIVDGDSDGNGFRYRCLDGGGSLTDDPHTSFIIFDN